MSYKLDVIQDHPVAFWLLDETSGSTAYDSSPYNNTAEYFGTFDSNNLPIVSDSQNSKIIDDQCHIEYSYSKDFIGNENSASFGTSETSNNSFSLECWIKLNFLIDSAETALMGDSINNIGLFWNNGSLIFKAGENSLIYSVPNYNKAMHVVGTYSENSLALYIDGNIVKSIKFENNIFTNNLLSLKSGPTYNNVDSFLIDCVAIYRYALSSTQIQNHYFSAQTIPSIQIVSPDNGQLFQVSDTGISREFQHSYPANKSWSYFNVNGLYYDQYKETLSLSLNTTEQTPYIEAYDVITVPTGFDLNSSKIEWMSTKGVDVYASIDNVSFVKCQNGSSIPRYKFGPDNFNESRIIYLSIRFSSTDITKLEPKIYNLMISFYNNKKVYSYNGGATISHFNDSSLSSDISFGNYYSPILFRDNKNGVMCRGGSGFSLNTNKLVKTLEFFYTPKYLIFLNDSEIVDIVSSNSSVDDAEINNDSSSNAEIFQLSSSQNTRIIYHADSNTEYSWGIDGQIVSSNIRSIYVNGVNKTLETSINDVIKENRLHHIVIVLDSHISGDIMFNSSTRGAVEGTYQNIAIYPNTFNSNKIIEHLDLWTGRYSLLANDSSFSLTENSISTYDNDWIVVQTV